MATTAVLYLSILSNSVLLIVLHQLHTPRPTLQPPQASTQDNHEAPRSVLERLHIDRRHEAAAARTMSANDAGSEPTSGQAERPPRYQRTPMPVFVDSDDDDDNHHPVFHHVRATRSHGRPRQHAQAERVDLNRRWEEVTINLNGQQWGIFSLSELVTILLTQCINPATRDILLLTESAVNLAARVDSIDTLVQQINTAIQGMATELGNTANTTTNTAQNVENIRRLTRDNFQELIHRTIEQQGALTRDTQDIRQRIAVIHAEHANLSQRVTRIEDYFGLDEVGAVQTPTVSSESSVMDMDTDGHGNGSEVAETVEEGSERSASV